MSVVRVLSCIQPWPWMILHLGKGVENRSRPVLGTDWRGDVLLHASKSKGRATDWKRWDEAHDFVVDRFGRALAARIPPVDELPMGGVVGRATVTGLVRPWFNEHAPGSATKPSVPVGPDPRVFPAGVDPRWHMAWQFGYLLADARETPFVRWRGWQSAVLAPAALLTALEEDPLS